MSHFYSEAIHPETGRPTRALFMDNYFGGHRYGVQFEGEEKVWRAEEVEPAKDRDK